MEPQPTPEGKPLHPGSVYAISKRDQEELCLVGGRAYGIPTVALRCFNVYGPGRSLSNPYTGVSAIYCSQLSHDNPPLIFEDGLQTENFVHVEDIVQAKKAIFGTVMQTSRRSVLSWGIGRELPWRTECLISYDGSAPNRAAIARAKLKLNWRGEVCSGSLKRWTRCMLASHEKTSSGGSLHEGGIHYRTWRP